MQTWWITKGKVTDVDAYHGRVELGQDEWQFSDTHPDNRGMSYDFLTLEEGLKALAPAIFHVCYD